MNLISYMKHACVFLCLASIMVCNSNGAATEQSTLERLPNLPSQKLNDTGITWRGTIPKGIDDNCTQKGAPEQQDCDIGRDIFFNNDSDGSAGFSYKKVDANGETLPNSASKWRCVMDDVSGFMWEVKSASAGLHNANDKFTWYNADRKSNGGKIGDWNDRGDHCYGYVPGKPKTYCHTEQLISRVNKQGLCGFHDWRLPTRTELTSLIHFGRTEPAIDTAFFPNTQADFYWTNSPTATRTLEAWTVSFEYGFTTPMRRTDTRYARLVRTNKLREKNDDKNSDEVNTPL